MPCYLLGKSTNNFFTAELFRPFHADFGLASPISEGCPTLCYKIFVYLFSIKYKVMLGAIIGDIAGSKYEFNNVRTEEFELMGPGCDYTDDTICTVALAEAYYGIPEDMK